MRPTRRGRAAERARGRHTTDGGPHHPRVGAGGVIVQSLERHDLYAIQTPQAFRRELLLEGHLHASANALIVDDDAALVEALGTAVHIVAGSPDNFKVTHPRDLVLLRALLADPA